MIGAGGMYLALRPPWGGAHAPVPADAGVVAQAPSDGGPAGPSKKKKRRRPGGTVAAPAPGDDPDGGYEETEPAPALTAADRALEWRGDDVTPPPARLDMSAGDARKLDDGEINATVASQADGVRTCVIQGATGTDLTATITVKLLVGGEGRVTRSRVQAPRYLHEHGLLPCVQRALGRMKFPATGAPTLVTFPINLS